VSLDLGALAERFRRADQPTPPPEPSAPAERPWLTAEAHLPPAASPVTGLASTPITGHGGGVYSNSAPNAEPVAGSPPRRATGRGPRRRRGVMPTSPSERTAEPVDQPPTLYRCSHCGERHQPFPMGGGGMAAIYSRPLDFADAPYGVRPRPLGRQDADTASLRRDGFHPWRADPVALPPPGPSTPAGAPRDQEVIVQRL
jgi:hypothetical protein